MIRPRLQGFFVTGTDTAVGKTGVAAALAWLLRRHGIAVGVFKPVETGCRRRGGRCYPADAALLRVVADAPDPIETIVPYRLPAARAPWVAASAAGVCIDLDRLVRTAAHLMPRPGRLIVEGAGGLLVPLTATASYRDLARRLGLPLVIVGRAGLGTINHTRLTVEAAQRSGLRVACVVLNCGVERVPAEMARSNQAALEALLPVPVLGPLPRIQPRAAGMAARRSVAIRLAFHLEKCLHDAGIELRS